MILCVFIVVVVLFACVLLNKKEHIEGVETAFLLVLDSDVNYKKAKEKQSEAEEVVSVSYLYEKASIYYVLGFIYFNEADAKSMLNSVKSVFTQAEILREKPIKLKRIAKNKLKKDEKILNIVNKILKLDEDVLVLCKDGKNKAKEFKIYHEIMKIKLDLKQIFSFLEARNDDVSKTVEPYLKILITLVDSCYDSIMFGEEIQEQLKILYMKIYFVQKELIISMNQ